MHIVGTIRYLSGWPTGYGRRPAKISAKHQTHRRLATFRPPRLELFQVVTLVGVEPQHHMGPNMGILISILITFLVIVLVLYLINMLPIDGRAQQIVRVVVIIIGVLSLLKYLAVY